MRTEDGHLPPLAVALGVAGLLPQLIALVWTLHPEDKYVGLSTGWFYAALILSFLGGTWWGAAQRSGAPGWTWVAAVVPSLVAFATIWPWMVGRPFPGPSLWVLGVALLVTPLVDRRLARRALVARGQLRLRVGLSVGLGLLTIALAARA